MTRPSTCASVPIALATHRDEQLAVERVRQGDALALEAIFTAFHAELIELARRVTGGRPALADDVVQDVFLAIWSGREQWRLRTTLRAYLRTSVHHAASRAVGIRVRAASHGISLEAAERALPERLADSRASVDRRAERSALADAVAEAASSLPPRDRDVFTLAHTHDLSNREIAARLGISVKTVEAHMTRARVFLRNRLGGWRG
ncbi:MAG TPA: sigma-70 family RNA polymerase sigma factor [Gemmatimonadaceae bacterium]